MKRKSYLGILLSLAMVLSVVTPAMATETLADGMTGNAAEIVAEEQGGNADETTETGEDFSSVGDDAELGEMTLNGTVSGDAGISGADDQDIVGSEVVGDEPADEAGSTDDSEPEEEGDDLMTLADEAEDEDADDDIAVTGVTLDQSKLTIQTKDQDIQLVATVEPADAADPSVTWSSSKESVVTVDEEGNLTAVKDGTATITVTTTDGGYTAECVVTVSLYSDGFHQEPDGTDWCYYKNGKIATGTTDLIQGTVNGTKGYWNVVKGRVVKSATIAKGTVNGTNAWWYVNKKGMVDTSYTGFATNSSGTWYAESGRVTKKTNGVIQDTKGALGSSSAWYYVINSKVQTDFTGLADYSNASGWWYITNGKVDRSVTTVAKNKNGWYYVKNGKVDRSYTGFAKNSSGSWYVKSGKVSKKVNGVIQDTKGALGSSSAWYYVINSKVQTGFTGLADYSNASGWWYITNGKVDRSVTTVAKNKNGWYYVKNGKVDRSYTGFATNSSGSWYVKSGKVSKKVNGVLQDTKGTIGKKNSWYYVLNSKVQTSFTGLADYSNASGWWYITNGKVDRSYNGLAKNKNGWFYVTNGKVDYSYTGTAQNSNGWWYVEKGKVDKSAVVLAKVNGVWQAYKSGKFDTSYTGIAVNENGYWYVKNGVLDRTYSGTYTDDSGTWTVAEGKATLSGDKGWVKIGNYYYYYDRSTGKMAKNTTVDGIKLDSSGRANASTDDVYKIQTMIKARELMVSITKTGDSQSEKLRKCYDWAAGMASKRIRYVSQTKREYPNTWTAVYANDGIKYKSGTCFTTACVFAYLAKECGYTSVYVCDSSGHAWVEINGLYYDPDMAGPGVYGKWYANTEPQYTIINKTAI